MVVIVTGYTLCVTSQYDVIFTFANQRVGKVVHTTCIFRDAGSAVGKQSRRYGGAVVDLAQRNKAPSPPKLNYEAL